MGLLDRAIVGVKNLCGRNVTLSEVKGKYVLTILEYGHSRSRTMAITDVEYLQECLWVPKAIKLGIVLNFAPDVNELYQRFEVPSWAMERLRSDMLGERIHLNVQQ
jgi:hypothetical protein